MTEKHSAGLYFHNENEFPTTPKADKTVCTIKDKQKNPKIGLNLS